MEIILQQNLKHQQIPVERICQVFNNVRELKSTYYSNPIFDLTDINLKNNITEIQKDIPYEIRGFNINNNLLNLDIKMETGTGKTYVYTKTIYELHKQYGINKFIIAVPSLPIKAGAKSFLSDLYVQKHFKNVCGYNSEIDLQVLSAIKSNNKKTRNYFPGSVREFVDGSNQINNKIYVLLVNMQLLSGNSKILTDIYDNSVNNFYQPYEALRHTHPFVIIDEPHKFSRYQKAYTKIINEISPQCIIRFGATFPEISVGNGKNKVVKKDYLNLLYDLNSYEAFNQNLIKGVAKEHFEPILNTEEKVKIISINNKESANLKYSKKGCPDKTFTLCKNDSLSIISSAFEGLYISALDKNHVYFSNGEIKTVGEQFEVSVYMTSYIEGMVKLAIDRHFQIERENFNRRIKIKTLTLFFIDDISSYRDKSVDGKEPYLKNCFEKLLKEKLEYEINNVKEYEKEYKEFLQASLDNITACHAGYFAQDNSDSDEEIEKEVQDILYNKKKLLSFKDQKGNYNTRRFLFSKWTLKEGWDNPNIFTICKLRSSGSEISKLQEVGRGLRLPVDEIGNRVSNDEFVLNYIVDFTEEDFAEKLIKEINGELIINKTISDEQINEVAKQIGISGDELFISLLTKHYIDRNRNIVEENRDAFYDEYPLFSTGLAKGKVIDRNKKQKNTIKIRKAVFNELKELWQAINQKYLLMFDNDINDNMQEVVNSLIDSSIFRDATIVSERVKLINENGTMGLESESGIEYNIVQKIPYNQFLFKISKATNLPITIINNGFVEYSKIHKIDDDQINNNTAIAFIQKFDDWKTDNLENRFRYKKADIDIYETALTNSDGSVKNEIVQGNVGTRIHYKSSVSPKYLYDTYAFDSPLEEKNLLVDNIEEIIVYGKIPRRSLEIPIIGGGTYTPDFMYVVKDINGNKTYNIIIETKDVENKSSLRGLELLKINNAKQFFKKLQQDGYDVRFKDQLNNYSIKNIINDILKK